MSSRVDFELTKGQGSGVSEFHRRAASHHGGQILSCVASRKNWDDVDGSIKESHIPFYRDYGGGLDVAPVYALLRRLLGYLQGECTLGARSTCDRTGRVLIHLHHIDVILWGLRITLGIKKLRQITNLIGRKGAKLSQQSQMKVRPLG